MEENQNTNEQAQPIDLAPSEVKETSEKATSNIPITSPKPTEEPITPIDPETQNAKLQTDTMEVHKHPHHVMHKKKWSEYLLEFFMIFFAVFLGFLVENWREQAVEKSQEKEYLVSMVRDLRNDMKSIENAIKDKTRRIGWADSVFTMFGENNYQQRTADLYFYCRALSTRVFFTPNDGTLQQLKNAGGLRLIKNAQVTDKIQDYSNQLVAILTLQQLEESQVEDYRNMLGRIFDALELNKMFASKTSIQLKKLDSNPSLLSTDKFDINNLNTKILIVKGNRLSQLPLLTKLKASAKELIEIINKEYHLSN